MGEWMVRPARKPLRGVIPIPADKSISHRAILLSALTERELVIENVLQSETTAATLECMCALGAEMRWHDRTLIVRGHGLGGLREPRGVLFCRGSGTTMRLLAGLCAGQDFLSVLDGTEALKRRPMARVIEPLERMGASILARDGNRLAPLAIRGAPPLRGLAHALTVASAQVKSAILIAGLFADGPTVVREPSASRDHTERMLRGWGVRIERSSPNEVQLTPPAALVPERTRFSIPNDISSAAFFIVAVLLLPGSEIRLRGIGLNPTRTGLVDVLAAMGARLEAERAWEENGEPVGDLVVRAVAGLRAASVGGAAVPRMIDEFPILAVAATQAEGETRVRDASELRVKESDRIAALAQELGAMGAVVEPQSDGFLIRGPTRLHGARVHSHGDHRLAMSLAVAGLLAEGETTILGWECVADSFPDFAERITGAQA